MFVFQANCFSFSFKGFNVALKVICLYLNPDGFKMQSIFKETFYLLTFPISQDHGTAKNGNGQIPGYKFPPLFLASVCHFEYKCCMLFLDMIFK